MLTYSVILKEDVAVDPRAYGDLLAPILGVTVVEARMAVRRGGGIFAENLPEPQARKLAEALEADGVGCWCVPAAALPPLRTPRRATAIETSKEGVHCPLQHQPEPQLLSWDRIGAVSIGLVLVPELQEEIAGVRKKDLAAVVRRDQEQRDQMRDRLLAVLTRVDLSHEENAPAAGAHHYFFDQLRRRESMQLRAFVDLVSDDGSQWWRLALEESGFKDRSGDRADEGTETCNFLAVPVIYTHRKDAHTERSRRLLQGGNVERLAFHTMEDFNRYTRWWTYRERLLAEPDLALPPKVSGPGGNGQAPPAILETPRPPVSESTRPKVGLRTFVLVVGFTVGILLAAGLRFERRGADCLVCKRNRQDDVTRLWGMALRETQGHWKAIGPKSRYDEIVGKDHDHLYDGFGYHQTALFGFANKYGRSPGGNASPEAIDALECGNALLEWPAAREATDDEVRDAYPRLVERVRSISDPAGRRHWLDLARAQPDREAPKNLLKEISK